VDDPLRVGMGHCADEGVEEFGGGFRLKLTEDGNNPIMRVLRKTWAGVTGQEYTGVKMTTAEIMEKIRVGAEAHPLAIGTINFGEQRRGGSEGLQISLVGDSSEELRKLSEGVIPILRKVEGLRDVRTDDSASNREVAVRVDRERAAQYGFSATQVATFVQNALRGAPLKEFRGKEDQVPVWLAFRRSDSASGGAPASPLFRCSDTRQCRDAATSAAARPPCRPGASSAAGTRAER